MHCKSCTVMVENELSAIDGVSNVKVSLKDARATFEADDNVTKFELEEAVQRAGYKVGGKRPWLSRHPKDYKIFLVGVVLSAVLFWLFSKLGIGTNLLADINPANVTTYSVLMGLTAGFSTCMALVGGLVVGISARHKQRHPSATRLQSFYPHVMFNVGRIIGFTLLGGVLGLVGSALTFSPFAQGLLTVLAGILMLVIGLQLTGIFPRLTSFSLPPKLAEKLGLGGQKDREYAHWRSSVLGVLTFFLPCGFTQAMQLFAVSTGSFATGALAMGLFAIGTTPGLLLVGGATAFINGKKGRTALKLVGVLVAALALISINSGLNLTGFRMPSVSLFSGTSAVSNVPAENTYKLTFIDPFKQMDQKELVLKAGQTYRIEINPEADGVGCMSTIMLPGLTERGPQLITKGKKIAYEFRADKPGEYQFFCAMGVAFDTKIKVEA